MERLLSPPPYFELSSRQEWWKTEEWLTVLNKTPCKFPLWTSDKYLYGHKGLFISPSPWMIYMLLSIFITHSLGLVLRLALFPKKWLDTELEPGCWVGVGTFPGIFSIFHSSHFLPSFPFLTFFFSPCVYEFHLSPSLCSLQTPLLIL